VLALVAALACSPDAARERRAADSTPASAPARADPQPAPGAAESPPGPSDTAVASAEAVVRDYYAAIGARDYAAAYRLWDGEGGASRKTFAEFRAGFAETAAVTADVGAAGRVGAAAGSRYVEVPVRVTARLTNGTGQRFRGTYTLRRSVVTGATPEQQAWRIYSARVTAER